MLSRGDTAGGVIAISSRVSKDYVRKRLPDGSFQAETYAFGKGGYVQAAVPDSEIEKLPFLTIATTLAGALKRQNYLPSDDPSKRKLLIMVYWGKTEMPEGGQLLPSPVPPSVSKLSATSVTAVVPDNTGAIHDDAFDDALTMYLMGERRRDRYVANTAAMLGYDSWWADTSRFEGTNFTYRDDMLQELEQDRYFVILMAYDWPLLSKQRKAKLLWETRYSVPVQRNSFGQALTEMTRQAARYFGQDSGGLRHRDIPKGRVKLGVPKVINYIPKR